MESVDHENGLERQHHVYLFETDDGHTDIYAHEETAALEGAEHLTETNQQHGDPQFTARHALDAADIYYTDNEI